MKLIPIKEAAKRNNLSRQRVSQLIAAGRVPGAMLIGTYWAIPENWKHIPTKRKPSRQKA